MKKKKLSLQDCAEKISEVSQCWDGALKKIEALIQQCIDAHTAPLCDLLHRCNAQLAEGTHDRDPTLYDDIDIALAGKAQASPTGWLPINEAAKDGRMVLLWPCKNEVRNNNRVGMGYWYKPHPEAKNQRGRWITVNASGGTASITHWMPLPTPPAQTNTKKKS